MADVTIDEKELADLRKAAGAGTKSAALVEALQSQLAEANKGVARAAELEGQLSTVRAAQQDASYASAGVSDAKIRKVFQMEFDEQAATETGEKDLGKWLAGMKAAPDKAPAHLAPFLGKPAAAAAGTAAGGNAAGKLPDGNKDARTVEESPPAFTAESIQKMTGQEFVNNFARIQAAVPGMSGVSLPPGAKPSTS